MPGARQDHRLRAPQAAEQHGALRAAGVVVVGAHQYAGKWQRLQGDRCEIAQRFVAAVPLDIRRRHQQGTGDLRQQAAVGASGPVGDGDAAEAVRDQHHAAGFAADFPVQRSDPVSPLRSDPVGLLDPRGVRQGALPVALPVAVVGTVPAGHDQVADAFVAHGSGPRKSSCRAF
ncbi:hypothetical protein D3C78_1068740 [compost metagenome]